MPIKLYYTPGACSLSPHIALREASLPFELVQVDLTKKELKSGGSFLSVNPKGYVPAIVLDDGTLVTEGAIIVTHIADQKPERRLSPKSGTTERLKFKRMAAFHRHRAAQRLRPHQQSEDQPRGEAVLP